MEFGKEGDPFVKENTLFYSSLALRIDLSPLTSVVSGFKQRSHRQIFQNLARIHPRGRTPQRYGCGFKGTEHILLTDRSVCLLQTCSKQDEYTEKFISFNETQVDKVDFLLGEKNVVCVAVQKLSQYCISP